MGNKRGKRKQQQQEQVVEVLGRSSSSSAATAAAAAASSSSHSSCAYIIEEVSHRSIGSNGGDDRGDGEEGGRWAASGKGKGKGEEGAEVGGIRCRHIGRGVNLEKLQEKLQKTELVQCHECHKADGSSPADGAREKKGKTKKVGKKKAQLNRSKNGVGVGAVDRRERSAMVCLACAHIGCAASGRNKEVQEEEDEEEEELGVGLGHARQHFLQWKHPLALHRGENLTVWCFQCNLTIRVDHSATSPAEESTDNSSVTSRVALLQQAMKLVHNKLVSPVQVIQQRWQIERPILLIESDTLSSHEQRKEKWMIRGLVNLGNTCFFNSVLQNLLALDLLRNHFCQAEHNREGFLTSALRRFYRDFYAGSNEATKDYNHGESNSKSARRQSTSDSDIGCTLSPKILFGAICARSSRFKGYQQQDSHELLRCLLDGLHIEEQTELSKAGFQHAGLAGRFSNSDGGHAESQEEPEEKSSKDCSAKSLNAAETFVEQMFGGQYSSTVSCCECSHSSVVYEPFLDLSLPLPTKSASKMALPSKGSFSQIKLSSLSARSGRPHVSKETKRRNTSMACNSEASKNTESGRKLPTSSDSGSESATVAEKVPTSITGGISSCSQSNDLVEDFTWIDYIGEEESAQANLTDGSPIVPSDYVTICCSGDGAPELSPFINPDLKLLDQQALQNSTSSQSGVIAASSVFPARVGSDHFEDCEKLLKASVPDFILLPTWSSDHITTGLESNEERDPSDGCTTDTPSLGNPIEGMADKCSKNSTVSCSGYSDAGTDFEGFPELFEEVTSYECVSLTFDPETDTEAGVVGPKQSVVAAAEVNSAQDESGDVGGQRKGDIQKGQQREIQIGKIVEFMSLEKCLKIFTASELLSGENAWGCDYCSRTHSVAVKSTSSRQSIEVCRNWQSAVLKSQSVSMPPVSEKSEAAAAAICMTGVETDASPGVVCQLRNSTEKTAPVVCSDSCNGSSHSASSPQLKDGCMPCINNLKKSSNGNQNCEKHVVLTEAGVCRVNEAETGSVELVCQLAFEELLESKRSVPESSKRGYDMVDASCCDGLGRVDNQASLVTSESCVMTEIDANKCSEVLYQRTSRLELFEKDAVKSEKHLPSPEAKENMFILERETEVVHEAESKLHISFRSEPSSSSTTKSLKKGLNPRKSQTDKVKAEAERIVKRNATKRLLISKAPPILTVHLKRFAQDNHGRLNKLYGHIAFSEWLDLHPYLDPRCSNSESWIYHLVGIVEHIGNMKGGHYVAYVRGNAVATEVPDMKKAESFQGKLWYRISDSHVTRTTIETVLRSEAYLLFYERIYIKSS